MGAPRTKIPSTREEFDDVRMNNVQADIRRVASAVNQRGASSVVIGPIAFAALETKVIPHGLMRVPEEWWPVDITGTFGVFHRLDWNDRTITIQSGNASTLKFRVA